MGLSWLEGGIADGGFGQMNERHPVLPPTVSHALSSHPLFRIFRRFFLKNNVHLYLATAI